MGHHSQPWDGTRHRTRRRSSLASGLTRSRWRTDDAAAGALTPADQAGSRPSTADPAPDSRRAAGGAWAVPHRRRPRASGGPAGTLPTGDGLSRAAGCRGRTMARADRPGRRRSGGAGRRLPHQGGPAGRRRAGRCRAARRGALRRGRAGAGRLPGLPVRAKARGGRPWLAGTGRPPAAGPRRAGRPGPREPGPAGGGPAGAGVPGLAGALVPRGDVRGDLGVAGRAGRGDAGGPVARRSRVRAGTGRPATPHRQLHPGPADRAGRVRRAAVRPRRRRRRPDRRPSAAAPSPPPAGSPPGSARCAATRRPRCSWWPGWSALVLLLLALLVVVVRLATGRGGDPAPSAATPAGGERRTERRAREHRAEPDRDAEPDRLAAPPSGGSFTSKRSGLCLGAPQGRSDSGAQLVQRACGTDFGTASCSSAPPSPACTSWSTPAASRVRGRARRLGRQRAPVVQWDCKRRPRTRRSSCARCSTRPARTPATCRSSPRTAASV
jgi:hypothetical protein